MDHISTIFKTNHLVIYLCIFWIKRDRRDSSMFTDKRRDEFRKFSQSLGFKSLENQE